MNRDHSLTSQSSIISHGIEQMELGSALTDLHMIDDFFSSGLNFVYKFELVVQSVMIILAFFCSGSGGFGESYIGPFQADYFVVIACTAWIAEIFIGWKIGYTDPVARLCLAALARRLHLNAYIGLLFTDYFFVQFGLGGMAMISFEHTHNYPWTLSMICVMLMVKMMQYGFFFVLKAWTYIFRMIPCCDWLLMKARYIIRSRPITLFCKNNVYPRHKKTDDELCAICHAQMNKDVVIRLPCKHDFHKDCIEKWFFISTRCPLCKQEVDLYHCPEARPLLSDPESP